MKDPKEVALDFRVKFKVLNDGKALDTLDSLVNGVLVYIENSELSKFAKTVQSEFEGAHYVGWHLEPLGPEAEAIHQEVDRARESVRRDIDLPKYNIDQWLNMITVKLGQAAQVLTSAPGDEPEYRLGRDLLIGLAVAAEDAIESLDSQQRADASISGGINA